MKKIIALTLAATISSVAYAETETYNIEPSHS
ncbi:MAG: polyisoprenoid-binding protein, partial [Sideroxydans sp.]|nr:polyisoprenoid-binding protein [Sideroxydans sp.]